MSRDRDLSPAPDRSESRSSGGGREMPRGGRSGGSGRGARPALADFRDALTQQLDLPRGREREQVVAGDRAYALRASEVRTLAAVGAFRVADVRDVATLRRDRWHGDVEQLRESGLLTTTPHLLDGQRTAVVALTREGQAVLEAHRRHDPERAPQAFYSGVVKPRELTHDAQLYRAYASAAERLHAGGARVERVVLDYELKRDYQRFLQHNNRAHGRRTGRPDRSRDEIRDWAKEHDLPIVGDRVQFPDVRIEYERPDGSREHQDVELATGHYNSRQMGAKRAAGFTLHHSAGSRLNGTGGRKGGSPFEPHVAERVLG